MTALGGESRLYFRVKDRSEFVLIILALLICSNCFGPDLNSQTKAAFLPCAASSRVLSWLRCSPGTDKEQPWIPRENFR